MTSDGHALHFDITPRQPRPRRDWWHAIRTMRALVRNQEDTQLAFEVFDALDPGTHARALADMLSHAEGRRIFAGRPSLRAVLCDRRALLAMPEGSFGRAYLDHLTRNGLDPEKLVELGRQRRTMQGVDADVRWMGERSQLTHDLWHVLTGYGADGSDEALLLVFSLAQAGGLGNLLLAFGANREMVRQEGVGWLRQVRRAWRMGRRATCLHALPYEELLPLPLARVRRAAGIEPRTV
ncbi:MAG: Coq4 family protein [Myxococcota bacterium]